MIETPSNLSFTLTFPATTILCLQSPPTGATGEQVNVDGTTATTATNPTGTPAAKPQGGLGVEVLLFGAVILFVLMTIFGGRREKKKFEQMLSSIKKHDSVRTVGGIIGSVVEVKPDVVVLKVDENSNTKITVARGKIEAVIKESDTKSEKISDKADAGARNTAASGT